MAKKYENPTTTAAGATTHEDSDEDCEVYFLKPVNEYNITDRIKEANKELFANANSDADAAEESVLEISNRKVTFALNLEDYEPNNGNGSAATAESCSTTTTTTKESKDDSSALQQHTKLTRDFKFPVIEEEDDDEDNNNNKAVDKKDNEHGGGGGDDDELVEEICEEIVIMDMEEQQQTGKPQKQSSQQRRQIVKQNTFAYEDDCVAQEEIEEITELTTDTTGAAATATPESEGDNKSLTNLLHSDGDEETDVGHQGDISADQYNNNNSDVDAGVYDDDEDDDDDKLSIIVASYISDDNDCIGDDDDTTGEYYDDTATLHANGTNRQGGGATGSGTRGGKKSRRILPFGKRFSLRRKVNSCSSNVIGISGEGGGGSGGGVRRQQSNGMPEITDLKLNYKTCCEYRNAVHEKLPKYTGYLSEYGLSAAQLAQRAERMQRKQRHLLEQTLKANEQEMQKMHDNERAFTTWLRNKIRFFPINRTRNMFEAKKSKKTKTTTAATTTIGFFSWNKTRAVGGGGGNAASIGSAGSGGKRKK